MTTDEAYQEGYNQAKADCLKLLAKWFFMTTDDAKECAAEMRALTPRKLK